MRTWIDVAVLTKTRGSEGGFVAQSAAGLPFLLEAGDQVALVPPRTDLPRAVRVAEVRLIDERSAQVRFHEVGDADSARQMTGMHCLTKRELVDEAAFREAPGAWEGWSVVDARAGLVGRVAGVVEKPGQSLLEVERAEGGTVLVPIVDEIVTDVSMESETVLVDLPNGLLEL